MTEVKQGINDLDALDIVFYDGTCVLCNRTAQFLIRIDSKGMLRYAQLQSSKSVHYLSDKNQLITEMNTVIYVKQGKIYTKSRAVLELLRKLTWWGKLCYVLILIPPFIRDGVYMLVSRNRYKWFGRSEECIIPDEDLKQRLILS